MPLPSSSTPAVQIQQFYDKGLAHASYAVRAGRQMAVIDPGRDPQPYYDFADEHDAEIVAVIETHPHADFVSSHLEIGLVKEASIYTSKYTGATYTHIPFDDGNVLELGEVTLHAINTPGHSPDSICVLLQDPHNQPHALFSGDTLFVGDVGRPDLHENTGSTSTSREALARDLYRSTREKILPLPNHLLLYPAHGAGSLCGKGISSAPSSSLGTEKETNKALQEMTEEEFTQFILADQPFVPAYFPYNVKLNKTGAPEFKASVLRVPLLAPDCSLEKNILIVDTRPAATFKQGHLPGAINLQNELKFETWLGSILKPEEKFYLVSSDEEVQEEVIAKTAKIGYEKNIMGALLNPTGATQTSPANDLNQFTNYPEQFTILDVRNPNEVKKHKPFPESLTIPLPELRSRFTEIPTDKPIVVHCAGGYRSAAGSSLLARKINNQVVYDLGEAIKKFN